MEENKELAGISEFRTKIKNLGVVFVTMALIANFIPAVFVSIKTGIFPSGTDLFKLWLAAAAAFGVGYFVQPISFFPMVNMAGSFMVWICGNVGELRVPAAAMAQKVTNCEQGSPKAEIMATIGIAASVFVSVTMITVFAIAGSQLMPLMPKAVLKGFTFILPAVLGAVYADLCGKNFVLGVIILVSSVLGTIFFPKVGIPGGMVMLVNIIVAVLIARVYYLTNKKA
ncbi:MAG: hypothetical protein GX451_04370 [Acholeplasmataceae bacterium]|nr:hypothetical protein [Acholeplasmataceae bacterium]